MNDRHMGPIEWCGAIFLSVAVLMVLMGGGGGPVTNSNIHNNNRTEVLSRNQTQLNIFSFVVNAPVGNTTTSTTTNRTEVSGSHNNTTDAGGTKMCWDEGSRQYTYVCPQVTP